MWVPGPGSCLSRVPAQSRTLASWLPGTFSLLRCLHSSGWPAEGETAIRDEWNCFSPQASPHLESRKHFSAGLYFTIWFGYRNRCFQGPLRPRSQHVAAEGGWAPEALLLMGLVCSTPVQSQAQIVRGLPGKGGSPFRWRRVAGGSTGSVCSPAPLHFPAPSLCPAHSLP